MKKHATLFILRNRGRGFADIAHEAGRGGPHRLHQGDRRPALIGGGVVVAFRGLARWGFRVNRECDRYALCKGWRAPYVLSRGALARK